MRPILFGVLFATMFAVAHAQQPAAAPGAPALKNLAASADVAALVAKAKSDIKPGQALLSQPLLQLAPYSVNVEYRVGVGNAAVHEREAELFYVIGGTATIVTGGQLVNPMRTNAENLTGTGVTGGTAQRVTKGDFVLVPDGSPHWFSAFETTPLVLMSLHLPRPARATP
jgi:mannose-6-phosphate isomerase-like protein (cupin superfamily)